MTHKQKPAKLGRPRILLVGAGRFGMKHLETLRGFEREKLIRLAGVVVNTKRSRQRLIRQGYTLPVYERLPIGMLDKVDAVDIVTPPETHFELVTTCLPKTNVLVEKPLTMSAEESLLIEKRARSSPHVLMVGHIFRFHPAVMQLKKILRGMKERPHSLESVFLNPTDTDNGRDIELEMLHPFDMIDYLFETMPTKKHVENRGRSKTVSLTYRTGMHALLKIGWSGQEKQRTLKIFFKRGQIICDLLKNTIIVYENGAIKKQFDCNGEMAPLEAELRAFIRALRTRKEKYPNAEIGHRIVSIATEGKREAEFPRATRKKVAIIGAGIFGTNCAIELAPFCNVTIFEKNANILSEASFINQYRHHWGYHYPRSQETVNDILSSITVFEDRYKEAVVTKFPTYYSVAKEGSKVTPEEYLKFCEKNRLPFSVEYPDARFLNKDKVSLCIKTYEPIYNYAKLKTITARLLKRWGVKTCLSCEVVGAHIAPDGSKILRIKNGKRVQNQRFDYVVNVTYARYNNFCTWLDFPRKPIRIDLVETLWVKLNIPRISLAVMDGPFSNIVPTAKPNIFTLVHIKESILRRFVPKDGLVPKGILPHVKRSRAKKIISYSAEWFPIVGKAKILKIYYVLRGVNAYREYDDARPSNITEHGFGCFSVLGGKIVNAVSSAKNIARLIVG